jgi:hypothetical protein
MLNIKSKLSSINDICHVMYINMDYRPDRLEHAQSELSKVGLFDMATRFSGIIDSTKNGAIGCTRSHIECLKFARDNKWNHVLICEDDITFLDPEIFKNHLDKFLHSKFPWDVVLLGGNLIPPFVHINKSCVKIVGGCQTTTGYIVNGAYLDTLIANMEEGLDNLRLNPSNTTQYAIDRNWIKLQRIGHWYIIIPLTVSQYTNYSDIEDKVVDYTSKLVRII